MKSALAQCIWLSITALLMTILPTLSLGASVDECTNMKPGWVFCSGFEEGSKAIWDDYDGNPDSSNLIISDQGPFTLVGNHVMKFIIPPGRGGADLVKVLPGSWDRIYARWYIKFEPGFDFTAGNHGSGLNAGDRNYIGVSGNRPSGADWFSAWLQYDYLPGNPHQLYAYTYYRGMYQDCSNPVGSCFGDSFPCVYGPSYCTKSQHLAQTTPVPVVADTWYCVEMMMDAGTPTPTSVGADGQLGAWLNGQQLFLYTDLWLRTTSALKLQNLWLNMFFGGTHANAGVQFDNVVVSTQPIGCAFGGSGTSVPSAPTNLRLVSMVLLVLVGISVLAVLGIGANRWLARHKGVTDDFGDTEIPASSPVNPVGDPSGCPTVAFPRSTWTEARDRETVGAAR